MRLQAPLITLMTANETTDSYEVSYNVLSHIHLLVMRGASWVFESQYKHFFIKYEEPSYIKNLKLEILAQVSSDDNVAEIVSELSEYVTDVNADIAKKSIVCFGTITIRLTKQSQSVVATLRNFLGLKIDYVTTETIITMKDILRKYPAYIEDFVTFFEEIQLEHIIEVDGKIAYVWILGEFGDKIGLSPYILEKMNEEVKELNSSLFTSTLINAAFKLFFKRAPEMHKILAQVFENVVKTNIDPELKQKVVFYHRIMQQDLSLA
mmetsp:Transcript_45288/g.61435  ORF Transcript_45288/g.61435 Transcript_45288/m.61435 type:complete len:265 (-) Transcript_45288:990-1784(-)